MLSKEAISIYIAISVFVANVFWQRYLKRTAIREKLKAEIVSLCDRMIRIAYLAEQHAVMVPFYLKQMSITDKDDPLLKYYLDQYDTYTKYTNDTNNEFNAYKSNLIKLTEEINVYWNESRECVIYAIKDIVFFNVDYRSKSFDDVSPVTTKTLQLRRTELLAQIPNILFTQTIGIYANYLQRLVTDSKFPFYYIEGSEKKKLIIENLKKYSEKAIKSSYSKTA